MCDELSSHPSWSSAHVAAQLGLTESFSNPTVNNFLNSTDSSTGISPLQVAVSSKNLQIVDLLINSQSSLEHLDYEGNSVFHYASNTSKDIIMV